jgi:hypothetical protein
MNNNNKNTEGDANLCKNNDLFPKCVICMELCENKYGNNPQPIKENGSCCDKCDISKVTPARMLLLQPIHNNKRKINIIYN